MNGHRLKLLREVRKKRALRVRKTLRGSAGRPRLSVHKSLLHIRAQLIDDEKGITLGAASTLSKIGGGTRGRRSKEGARLVGEKIAEIAKAQGIDRVIFDRGRFKYHGLVEELAESSRRSGLKF